jgi:hypothetical protein
VADENHHARRADKGMDSQKLDHAGSFSISVCSRPRPGDLLFSHRRVEDATGYIIDFFNG